MVRTRRGIRLAFCTTGQREFAQSSDNDFGAGWTDFGSGDIRMANAGYQGLRNCKPGASNFYNQDGADTWPIILVSCIYVTTGTPFGQLTRRPFQDHFWLQLMRGPASVRPVLKAEKLAEGSQDEWQPSPEGLMLKRDEWACHGLERC
ncbi:pstS [Symbiodinium sp. CCMP2592]|nr:pstS [Symbiodinium sp. CCMP2592]